MTQLYDLVLAPARLKATQFVLLRFIAEAGEVAQCQISRELSVAVETLTRRLAAMRKCGWVELRMGIDKREHLYSITDLGRAQLDRAQPYWERAEARLREQLGDSGWREMQNCLSRVTSAAGCAASVRRKNTVG